VLLALSVTSPASAHAYLQSSNPPDGSTLARAPRLLVLSFSEHVVLNATTITVTDGGTGQVRLDRLRLVTRDAHDTEEPARVEAVLPALRRGTYQVSWRTISSDDLHETSGVLVFGVRTRAVVVAAPENRPPWMRSAAGAVTLLGLAVALGGRLALRVTGLLAGPGGGLVRRRLARLAVSGATVAVLGGSTLPVSAAVADHLSVPSVVASSYGLRWASAELGLLVLLAACVGSARDVCGTRRWRLVAPASVLAGTGIALLGHAGSGASVDWWRVAATCLHLLAALTWVGATGCLGVVLLWTRRAGGPLTGIGQALRRFAGPAAVCVGVAVVTGVYLSSDVVVSVDAVVTTLYGRLLAFKVALAALAALLGLVNHRRVRSSRPTSRIGVTVAAEAAIGLAVVLVTALVTNGQPAVDHRLVDQAAPTAGALSRQVEDLQESVSIRPNRPGPAVLSLDVFDTRRPAPEAVSAVLVRVGSAPRQAATALGDGHWSAPVQALPGGTSRVEVTVSRGASDTVSTQYRWTAGAAVGTPHTVVSRHPVRGALRTCSAALAVVALLLAAVALVRRQRRKGGEAESGSEEDDAGRPDNRMSFDPDAEPDGRPAVGATSRERLLLLGVVLVVVLVGSASGASPTDALRAVAAGGETGGPAVPRPHRVVQPPASLTAVKVPATAAPVTVGGPHVVSSSAHTPRPGTSLSTVLLDAYRNAARLSPARCRLPVSLLAAIGQVESGSLAGSTLDAHHRTSIFGPVLDGHHGFAPVADTDHGRWDRLRSWDRAVGPMQFIPSTWRIFGVDGDRDGTTDPQDLEDASASTAAYLCYGGRDLADPAALRSAVLSYNHSEPYLRLVLTYAARYAAAGLDGGAASGRTSPVAMASGPLLVRLGGSPASGGGRRHRSHSTGSARGAEGRVVARTGSNPPGPTPAAAPTVTPVATPTAVPTFPTSTASATAAPSSPSTSIPATTVAPSPAPPQPTCATPIGSASVAPDPGAPVPGAPATECAVCGTPVPPTVVPTPVASPATPVAGSPSPTGCPTGAAVPSAPPPLVTVAP
jgi:copper transport protein